MPYNESWFWAQVSAVVVALATIGAGVVKDWLAQRAQVKLERVKMHEARLIDAYAKLYAFISEGFEMAFPGSEPRTDFVRLMKDVYFKAVKADVYLFPPDIRNILEAFEFQYTFLDETSTPVSPPFNDFIGDLPEHLRKLKSAIENRTDKIFEYK